MKLDYKKTYKEMYLPKNTPSIISIPRINYIAVRGKGNPNEENSEYKESIGLLYGIIFTIKMSKYTNYQIEDYFDFVVPPLEGLWWQEDRSGIDYNKKEDFHFLSLIRLPEFVTKDILDWAIQEATIKKKVDFSKVEYFTYEEGLCVQCMHIGSYDDEPSTILLMDKYIQEQGYELDFQTRFHHEIYLSDPRKTAKDRCKTVIRHPIKKI